VTLLNYWVDSVSVGSFATFWVKIAGDLSLANQTIYIYYGNPNALTTSNQFTADVMQLREQQVNPSYAPDLWFYGGTTAYLFSTTEGLGFGWAFFSVPKSWINGKYLRWCWEGYWDYTDYQYEWSVRIYDGAYKRTSSADFPVQDSPALKGAGLLQHYDRTANRSFGPETAEFLVNVDSAQCDSVTVFLLLRDGWIAHWMVGMWDFVEINSGSGGSGNIARVDFTQSLGLIEYWGYGDYGLMRKYVSPEPIHGSWGAEERMVAAAPVYVSTYDQGYESNLASAIAASSIAGSFGQQSTVYAYAPNEYGGSTAKARVYQNASFYEATCAYVTVFHYGHYNFTSLPDVPGVPQTKHWGYYDSLGDSVWDTELFCSTSLGKHYFVFLWTCVLAEELGYWDSVSGTGAVGLPYAWTHHGEEYGWTIDGYANDSPNDYCFISFLNHSRWLNGTIPGTAYTYTDFLMKFYQEALQEGSSINDALNLASAYVLGNPTKKFSDMDLYTGYEVYDPEHPLEGGELWKCKMLVLGNGDMVLPQGG
jgi:hypothetical protein